MAKKKELEPPSEKEIRRLPRWAQVAFAARCARRVQPLFQAGWPKAPAEHVEAVKRAIRIAETGAAGTTRAGAVAVAASASAATRAVSAASGQARLSAASAAYAADAAAVASTTAAFSADASVVAASARASAAASAAFSAGEAARAVHGAVAETGVIRAMRADLDKLQAVAKQEGWTDETPVPPEFFGPLWPEGEPPGWPVGQE